MLPSDVVHNVASTIGQAGFLKVLFPLLTVVGPGLFLYFGYLGVAKRRTIILFRPRGGGGGAWVTGGWALGFGVFYLIAGPLMLLLMGPIAAAMVGIW